MPINVRDVADLFGKDVFTAKGFYCGRVSDVEFDLARFKIRSLVVEAAREGFLGKTLGGKKGVIVPYPVVQAVGDIVIIKHINVPEMSEEVGETTEEVGEEV
ncbi:MAG: PRC-barrel domain-containing protein [Candidatus Aenigmatarchaeota archaeon]